MSFLVIAAVVLQVVVLLSLSPDALTGPTAKRLTILTWLSAAVTVVVAVIYILIFLQLSRLSPGLLLFAAALLGAGLQLAGLSERRAAQIRLGAWVVLACLVVFYVLNTLS